MPSPKSSPKDDGGPRFLKKILGETKKKKRKIVESDDDDDDDDGFHVNPSFGDSDDEGPATRGRSSAATKRHKTDNSSSIPKKSKLPRKEKELSVPKKQDEKADDAKKKKKGTSSLLANMQAPPPDQQETVPKPKGPGLLSKMKLEGKESSLLTRTPAAMLKLAKQDPSSSAGDAQPQQPPPPLSSMTSPKRGPRPIPTGSSKPPLDANTKLEAFPSVSSPPPQLVQNLVVANNKPMDDPTTALKKKMTPKGRMMMSTLEKLCTKLNDNTQFQLFLRGNLPVSTQIDLSGSFSYDDSQAFDFFNCNANGELILPPKIAIFPEEFRPGFTGHSLHWWGIVDPAVGARTKSGSGVDSAPAATTAAVAPSVEAHHKTTIGGGGRGGGGNELDRDQHRRGGGRDRRSPGRYNHGHGGGGGPPPPGWGGGGGSGGGGRWEEDYGRWEGGGRGPPPPHWGGGGGGGNGPDGYWDGGGRRGGGGDPHHPPHHHHHRGGGPPPPNPRGRGPPPPSMDRPPMDRPPMDRGRGPPSGGRGGRRDRL